MFLEVDNQVPEIPASSDLVFIFESGKLYLNKNQELPSFSELEAILEQSPRMLRVSQGEDRNYYLYLGVVKDTIADYSPLSIRGFLNHADDQLQAVLHSANHIYQWHQDSRFCSRCGEKLAFKTDQLGKQCMACQTILYPRINPCIIVAITRKGAILLAEITRNNRSFSSVLAGYVEVGESLEQCVAREIREEVGIEVKNIRYFGSQAWSFSQSLMVAFVAEYHKGEIRADGIEIHQADWYNSDNLPDLPPHYSIARELIEWFRKK